MSAAHTPPASARTAVVLDYARFRSYAQNLVEADTSSAHLGMLLLNVDGMPIIDSTLGFDLAIAC